MCNRYNLFYSISKNISLLIFVFPPDFRAHWDLSSWIQLRVAQIVPSFDMLNVYTLFEALIIIELLNISRDVLIRSYCSLVAFKKHQIGNIITKECLKKSHINNRQLISNDILLLEHPLNLIQSSVKFFKLKLILLLILSKSYFVNTLVDVFKDPALNSWFNFLHELLGN